MKKIGFTEATEMPVSYWTIPGDAYPEFVREHEFSAFNNPEVLLADRLLPVMTQEQLSKRTAAVRKVADFNPADISSYGGADMPFYHRTFAALSQNRKDSNAITAIEFTRRSMRYNWLMTLTRVKYMPMREDVVIHNFNMRNSYRRHVDFVGPDEFISESKDTSFLEALLGTSDARRINKVYQGINETDVYIWRVNNKPSRIDERVAGFAAGSGRVRFYCVESPESSSASLGVRVREAQREK